MTEEHKRLIKEAIDAHFEGAEDKFILAFDTMCTGWDCSKTEVSVDVPGGRLIADVPCLYDSQAEAEDNIDDEDEFVVPFSEYIHGRKFIFGAGGGQIKGGDVRDDFDFNPRFSPTKYYAIWDGTDYLHTGYNSTNPWEVREGVFSLEGGEGMSFNSILIARGWELHEQSEPFPEDDF